MRTFAQKQNQPQKQVSPGLARSNTAAPGLHHRADLILDLQCTIGNQAVQRILQTNVEELKARLTGPASPRFGNDFSRIPIHPPAVEAIQTDPVNNQPEDKYEQEADRISEQVMRCLPEPQLQHASAGGGACSKCQTKQAGRENERLETKHVQASDRGQIAAAPIVHEVVRASGQPLDAATRSFMEPRFGHDFSRVRVHADAKAAESARAMNALAYTVGHDMVFGAGQYVPETSEGRRLVAHELTHVLQQTTPSTQLRPAQFAWSSMGSVMLQRQPDKTKLAERRRDQQLEELARDPGEAHLAWKKLSEAERNVVVEKMRRRYGEPFAQQFLEEVKKGKSQIETHYYSRGMGPKPSELIQKGYQRGWIQLIAADMEVEWWVHPSGRYIRIDVGTWKPGAAEAQKEPGTKAPPVKLPPTDGPEGKVPPMTDEQVKALDALEDLQNRNNELQEASFSDPYPKKKAQDAQSSWAMSRSILRDLKNVNMDNVYPNFWKEVDAATAENDDLLKKLCVLDRFFCIE